VREKTNIVANTHPRSQIRKGTDGTQMNENKTRGRRGEIDTQASDKNERNHQMRKETIIVANTHPRLQIRKGKDGTKMNENNTRDRKSERRSQGTQMNANNYRDRR